MTATTTWILRADRGKGRILVRRGSSGPELLYRLVVRRTGEGSLERFTRYLARELELACGAGTESRLDLRAPKVVALKVRKRLSDQVAQRLV